MRRAILALAPLPIAKHRGNRPEVPAKPPSSRTKRARRAPRCHWMLPMNFRARIPSSLQPAPPNSPNPRPLSSPPHLAHHSGVYLVRTPTPVSPTFPTPLLRASSIIFVRARGLASFAPADKEGSARKSSGAGQRETRGRRVETSGGLGKRAPPFRASGRAAPKSARYTRPVATNSRLMRFGPDIHGCFAC